VALREELISRNHDDPIVGHYGPAKTISALQTKYYWPKLTSDIKSYYK